jgi:hypothetical protein
MTPTLSGRLQTRVALMALVAVPLTLLLALLPGVTLVGGLLTILVMTALGLGWELVYHALQQLRWDKDWPSLLGLVAGIPEALALWAVLGLFGLRPSAGAFALHIGLVSEVLAEHERAERERLQAERAEHARLVEEAIVREEARLADEARAAEQARLDLVAAEAQAAEQEAGLARLQGQAGPFLEELAHRELPPTLLDASQLDGPPPIPDAARRYQAPVTTAPLVTMPPPHVPNEVDQGAIPTSVLTREDPRKPRTGRWLITTIIGAVSLALLLPLAVAALRSLVTLG